MDTKQPPKELVFQWFREASKDTYDSTFFPVPTLDLIASRAAEWGADQELEACCRVLDENHYYCSVGMLQRARRPVPPTLKEQALGMLSPPTGPVMLGTPKYRLTEPEVEIIRKALRQLPDE